MKYCVYLSQNKLALQRLDETIVWHDTGNADALLLAAQKVKKYEIENINDNEKILIK